MESAIPEDFIKPEPFPSVSTPAWMTNQHPLSSEKEQHSISRPNSAMSLYPESYFGKENDDDDDDGGQQEAFNRISGILSNLLEEANNAIHGVENENNSDADASDKREQEDYSNNNIRSSSPAQRGSRHMHPSRLPRPIYTKSRRSSNLSIASSSSCSVYSQTDSLFSPASSTSSRATSPTMSIESRPSSPQKLMVATTVSPTMVVKKRTSRPLSCPVLMARRSSGEGGNIRQQQQQQQQQRMRRASAVVLRDPLVESYKRLDSSMALVESLSRDLAASDKKMQQVKQQQQPSSALRLSALLILPFLHIPHALISMVFDSLSTKDPNNLTGMIAWGIFFALANVMVDRVIYPTRQKMVDIDTTTTTTTATTTTDKLPPQQQQHTPAMYIVKRRSRVIRRPSVYRKQPHSSALARSRTQPMHSSPEQPSLFSTSRMIIKRRYSF